MDLIRRPQSISMVSHGATSRARIAPGASSPAPCSCANTRASGTPSLSLRDLCKPLHHREGHHRHGLERSPLLRAAERRKASGRFVGSGRCVVGGAQ